MEIKQFGCEICKKIFDQMDKPLIVYEIEITKKEFTTFGGVKDYPSLYKWKIQCCEDCVAKLKD